jgi:hypothetical protein
MEVHLVAAARSPCGPFSAALRSPVRYTLSKANPARVAEGDLMADRPMIDSMLRQSDHGMSRRSVLQRRDGTDPAVNPARFVVLRGVRVLHLRFAAEGRGLLVDRGDGPELWDRARILPRWVSRLRIEEGRRVLAVTVCGRLDPEWAMRPGQVTPLREGGGYFADLVDLAPSGRPPWDRRLRARQIERRRLLSNAAVALPANWRFSR